MQLPTAISSTLPNVAKMSYLGKTALAKTGLVALGVAFEILSQHSDEMRAEIADWDEGRTIALGVLPAGPTVAVRKAGGKLEYLGSGMRDATVRILFKNLDCALLVLLGTVPAHVGFAEHRAVVHGAIDETMQANRAMVIVVKYLFPGFMLRSLMKRMPTFNRQQLALKARLYATIAPALVRGLTM